MVGVGSPGGSWSSCRVHNGNKCFQYQHEHMPRQGTSIRFVSLLDRIIGHPPWEVQRCPCRRATKTHRWARRDATSPMSERDCLRAAARRVDGICPRPRARSRLWIFHLSSARLFAGRTAYDSEPNSCAAPPLALPRSECALLARYDRSHRVLFASDARPPRKGHLYPLPNSPATLGEALARSDGVPGRAFQT